MYSPLILKAGCFGGSSLLCRVLCLMHSWNLWLFWEKFHILKLPPNCETPLPGCGFSPESTAFLPLLPFSALPLVVEALLIPCPGPLQREPSIFLYCHVEWEPRIFGGLPQFYDMVATLNTYKQPGCGLEHCPDRPRLQVPSPVRAHGGTRINEYTQK